MLLCPVAQSEEAWRRENARLREQLAAASKREAVQTQQLNSYEAQLAGYELEIEQLQKLAAKAAATRQASLPKPPARIADDALSISMRERELLRLVIELAGKDSVRTLLRENPHASPIDLRHALVQLRQQQQQQQQPSRQAPPSLSYKTPSGRSHSPSRDHPSMTVKPQRQVREPNTADRSSPALDAIYAK